MAHNRGLGSLLAVVAAGLLARAGDGSGDAVREELQKLQGTWDLVSLESGGTKATGDDIPKALKTPLVIKGDRAPVTFEGKTYEATVRVDPTKDPKTMDRVFPEGKPFQGAVVRSIYKLEGETLTICSHAEMEHVRPREFTSKGVAFISVYRWQDKAEDGAGRGDFFNGKDLAGWEGLTDRFWAVKDGAIVGSTLPGGNTFNTFLCSKSKYKDFELRFKVRLVGKGWTGNSGVQFRSRMANRDTYAVSGPQADIGDGYWGNLHGELFGGRMKEAPHDKVNEVLKENDFNDYSVRCVGKHVTIRVNGVTTVDDDFGRLPDEGIIAWQLHEGKGMEVTFKDIRFRNLSVQEK